VVRRWREGESQRAMAGASGVAREMVGKYLCQAQAFGLGPTGWYWLPSASAEVRPTDTPKSESTCERFPCPAGVSPSRDERCHNRLRHHVPQARARSTGRSDALALAGSSWRSL
jgi:hypothetical protein